MSTILVVDDEPRVVRFLTRCLGAQGYVVLEASGGREALALLARHDVDLVLLDVMMPGCSGMQVLHELETWGQQAPPVIILSAVTEIGVRVQALETGAVDFVQKPFELAELVARVRRHLIHSVRVPQQRAPEDDGRYLSAAGIQLDLDRRRARGAGFDVALSEREFGLLAHLMRRQGRVCSKEELWHDVWNLPFDPGSNIVEVCVRRLRSKLGDPPIETVRGVGYCLVVSSRVRAS